jgi:hypothetical protein
MTGNEPILVTGAAGQLGLVEGLGGLQGRVGRQPATAVHLPLELGQVEQPGRRVPLPLAVDSRHGELCTGDEA